MGTFEPTVHPLWCRYVWNNEIVNGTFEFIAEAVMPPLLGTPLAAACLRLMGCRIGKWVYLETTYFSEFDLVHIGDHAAINFGATIQTHLFEDRVMKADHLRIGDGASVGNMAVVLYDTEIRAGREPRPVLALHAQVFERPGRRLCEPVPPAGDRRRHARLARRLGASSIAPHRRAPRPSRSICSASRSISSCSR